MKKLLLATTGLLALVASAPGFAADLPARPYTKAPPAIVATINDWSGFYVGFNAGGGSSRDRWNLLTNGGVAVNPALSNEGTTNAGGAAVGGQIGYRSQVSNWSVGVEYDHLFMGNKNLNFVTAAGLTTMTHRINQDIDIGLLRVNYKFGPSGIFGKD